MRKATGVRSRVECANGGVAPATPPPSGSALSREVRNGLTTSEYWGYGTENLRNGRAQQYPFCLAHAGAALRSAQWVPIFERLWPEFEGRIGAETR